MCKHWECACYAPETETCDYMIIFGESRGCPPTDDCPKFRTNFKDVKIHIPRNRKRTVDLDAVERMRKAYNKKLTTEKMAIAARVKPHVMLSWIRKVHPEYPRLDTYGLKW